MIDTFLCGVRFVALADDFLNGRGNQQGTHLLNRVMPIY